VARNTTNNNDINTSKLAEFSKDESSKTLVEFVEISTKTKKAEENDNNIIKNGLQNKVVMAIAFSSPGGDPDSFYYQN
jgi:hypothetical protein